MMTKIDQRYFDEVATELSNKQLKPGLWARAFAESGGDDAKARASYIRLRALDLKEEAEPKPGPTTWEAFLVVSDFVEGSKSKSIGATWSEEKIARVEAARKKMVTAWRKFAAVALAIVAVIAGILYVLFSILNS